MLAAVKRPGLIVQLESPLPQSLPAGSATAVFCSGSASAGGRPVGGLELLVDGTAQHPEAWRMPRFDLPCRRSGFWGLVAVRAPAQAGTLTLAARARLRDGSTEEVTLGYIEIVARADYKTPRSGAPRDALIGVCMATFNPRPDLLAAQLHSLRAQTDTNWICVISDDHSDQAHYAELQRLVADDQRFALSRSEDRLGVYRNFERALQLAPAGAGLIALCDQDDVWHAAKLAKLRASLGEAQLVYCDQRLIDEHGALLRGSFWSGRANNSSDLASLLVANTVTGAAALMRREVVHRALPFPDTPAFDFHDHWLALVALASGDLAYLDEPLYDYVQHPDAILGRVARPLAPGAAAASGAADCKPAFKRVRGRLRMRVWRAAYFIGYVPGKLWAQTLQMRCADRLTADKAQALARFVQADRSLAQFAWLLLRPSRALVGRNETLGGEWELTPGIIWLWLAAFLASRRWLPERLTLDTRLPEPDQFEHRRLRRWRAAVGAAEQTARRA
jgi:glycosyltransferase involved in cell wall biosynthesis